MSPDALRIWLLLGIVSAADVFWCAALGLALSNWRPFLLVAAALLGLSVTTSRAGRLLRLGGLAEWTLLWLLFSAAGAVLTYAAATRGGVLYDRQLAALDRAIGFDWSAWVALVNAHPGAKAVLHTGYESLLAQIMLSVAWFTWRRWPQRNAELLANATLALLLTTAIFCLFPAFGPGVGLPGFELAYVDDLTGLRNGTLPALDVMLLKGVITFPSFHAVLAVLFTWSHRGSISLVPAAALNAVMLVGIPSEGGHYLVDIFGGLAVAGFTIVALRALPLSAPAPAAARLPGLTIDG
jgi:hypothetical protein